MIINYMKEQFIQKSISTVDILINYLTIFQIGIVFWKITTPKE